MFIIRNGESVMITVLRILNDDTDFRRPDKTNGVL